MLVYHFEVAEKEEDFLSSSNSVRNKGYNIVLHYLTLKAPNKNCSSRHFNFLLLSFEENKA